VRGKGLLTGCRWGPSTVRCRAMALPGRDRAAVVVGLTALVLLSAAVAHAASSDSTHSQPSPHLLTLTQNDAWYWLGAGAAIGGAAFVDLQVRERALTWDSDAAKNVAKVANQVPLAAGLAAVLGYVGGRAFDHPDLENSSRRIGISMAVAGVATELIKWPVGRVRPDDSDTETDNYQPFSGNLSFPSGHTSLSFAWATAVDRETKAGWVPWVVYPIATVVGWARVRDDKHWASDVVAGAALGGWTAWKTEDYLRARDGADVSSAVGLGSAGATIFAVRVKF
jgi:membrane-associated phospholipid phosphatase